jgi:hypothetical protein
VIPRRVRGVAVAVAVVAGGVSVVGCTSGERLSAPSSSSVTTSRPVPLPPRDTGALVKLVAPLLPTGDEIQRVYLDVSGEPGSVLFSIDVRRTSDRTPDEYAQALAPLAKRLIPVLFARYPGVDAIDLCQELPNDLGAAQESPPPVTRVLLSRQASALIDWATFDLRTVRRLARGKRPEIQLQLDPDVAKAPSFVAAAP